MEEFHDSLEDIALPSTKSKPGKCDDYSIVVVVYKYY